MESLLGLKWLDAALGIFNQRLRQGEAGAEACRRMAGLLQDADAMTQAEALLASALADWPEMVDLHLAMANLHFHSGDRARAEQVIGLAGLSPSADDLAARAMLYHGWSMNPSDDDDVVTGRHGIRENAWIALSIAQQVHSLSQQPAPNWQAVNCREYRRDAVRWANRCRTQLEARGFRYLGDFEDMNLLEQIGQRVFVRLMLDEAGTTAAAVYSLRVPWPGLRGWLKMMLSGQRRRFYMVELESAVVGDTFLITNNSESVDPFEYGDVVEKQSLPHRTSLPALLQRHADGLQRWQQAGRSLQPVAGVEELIERQDRQRQAKNRYRREIGYVTDQELSGLLGDRFDELAPLVRDKLMELASLQPA